MSTKPAAKPPQHPPYITMTQMVICESKERGGCSRQAVCKLIEQQWPAVGDKSISKYVTKALKKLAADKKIENAHGSKTKFKMSAEAKAAATKKPAKKPVATKKPAAKKPKKPLAAKKPATKKPADKKKKAVKKATTPAKKSVKKPTKKPKKSPVKKAGKKPTPKKAGKKPGKKSQKK